MYGHVHPFASPTGFSSRPASPSTASERIWNNLKGSEGMCLKSGLDCLFCARFDRQRTLSLDPRSKISGRRFSLTPQMNDACTAVAYFAAVGALRVGLHTPWIGARQRL